MSSRYHHGNLREELLTQAHALLSESGVAGISLRQVASRAGVSRTAPYHHFKDKDALLAALVARGFTELVADMRAAVDTDQAPVIERFEAMGRAYVGFALREPHLYQMMFGSRMQHPEEHPHVVAVADQAFAICRDIVAEGQASGEIGGDQPLLVALAAWSTVHGLATLLLAKRIDEASGDSGDCEVQGPMSGVPVELLIDGVLQTLSNGLRSRPPSGG